MRQQASFLFKEELTENDVRSLISKYPIDGHKKQDLYKRTAQKLLNFHPRKNISVLDVGASCGFFLKECERLGVAKDKLIALEMSPNYIELTKRYFGYRSIRANIEDLEKDTSYDLITLFDVLEHVHDFPKTIKAIDENLNPNGILFLKLPNGRFVYIKTLVAKLFGQSSKIPKLLYIQPGGHLNYWSPRNIHRPFGNSRLSLIETDIVKPTKRQFGKRYPFYITLWYISKIFRLDVYPEFYAVFKKAL